MKKLVITLSLVLALVIAATVSVPMLMASVPVLAVGTDINMGDTTLSVTINGTVEIGTPIDPTTEMTPPVSIPGNASAAVPVTVSSNVAHWTLKVVDNRSVGTPIPVKGYMDNGVGTTLLSPLSVMGGDQATLAPLTSDVSLETDGAAGGPFAVTATFSQPIAIGDGPGTYNITVSFIATIPL